MSDTLVNPTGAGFFNVIDNGAVRESYRIDPEVEGGTPFGTLMEIEAYDGPGGTNPPSVPLIQPSSTDQDDQVIGVVVAGLSYQTLSIPLIRPGEIAFLVTRGICQVLADASTTSLLPLVASPTTPGCVESTETPSSRTVGLCLESVTIESGTALVWAYIDPGTQGGTGGGGSSFPKQSGVGSPNGVVTPITTGSSYQDTASGALYLANGTTNSDWILIAGHGDQTIPGVWTDTDGNIVLESGVGSVAVQNEASSTNGVYILDQSTAGEGIEIDSYNGSVAISGDTVSLDITAGSGIGTRPVLNADTATSAFGQVTIGTPLQNTTGSDLLVVVTVPVTVASGGHLTVGVDSSATPTAVQYSPALAAAAVIPVVAWVPASSYLLVGTSGTITVGTPQTSASPL